jgi:hypothetical protein
MNSILIIGTLLSVRENAAGGEAAVYINETLLKVWSVEDKGSYIFDKILILSQLKKRRNFYFFQGRETWAIQIQQLNLF